MKCPHCGEETVAVKLSVEQDAVLKILNARIDPVDYYSLCESVSALTDGSFLMSTHLSGLVRRGLVGYAITSKGKALRKEKSK